MIASCPLCGTRFDPDESPACAQCPLARGCTVTCCPGCGYSWVEPSATRLGRWLTRRLPAPRGPRETATSPQPALEVRTLADVPPRGRARVRNCDGLPDERRRRLRAYGLTDGGIVAVVQQSPATMIVLDHTEVALETELARCILVEVLDPVEDRDPRTSDRASRR